MGGGRFGHAISEYSNWKVLLPKPLGRTMVLLQQQRQQRVYNGSKRHEQRAQQGDYSLGMGVEQLNTG